MPVSSAYVSPRVPKSMRGSTRTYIRSDNDPHQKAKQAKGKERAKDHRVIARHRRPRTPTYPNASERRSSSMIRRREDTLTKTRRKLAMMTASRCEDMAIKHPGVFRLPLALAVMT